MRYVRYDNGDPTTFDDPKRFIWYGVCTYWTDDIDKLSRDRGIPCCPICRAPGFQAIAVKWFLSAIGFGGDRYIQFLTEIKEQCVKGETIATLWKKYNEQQS